MMYELTRLEEWVAQPALTTTGLWDEELSRIRVAMMNVATGTKKDTYLHRYFRLHQDGLEAVLRRLKKGRSNKAKKELLELCEELAVYITDHFGRYLGSKEELDPDDPDIDAYKVVTTFTVPELGVIIRLFIETGAFRIRNRKALTRFMSRHVAIRSKQVPESFSEDHLYNAIHSPDQQGMDHLQELLNAMLVQLNKLRRDQRKSKQ